MLRAPCLRMDTNTPSTCIGKRQRLIALDEPKTQYFRFIFKAGRNGEASGPPGGHGPFRIPVFARYEVEVSSPKPSTMRKIGESRYGQRFQACGIVVDSVEFHRGLTETDLCAPATAGHGPIRRKSGMLALKLEDPSCTMYLFIWCGEQ